VIRVSFPAGVRVDAVCSGRTISTDQPAPLGTASAPSPFDLFLASIATCAGFYALRFCQERGLSTEGLALSLEPVREPSGKRVATVRIELTLPENFPAKYREAILRAVDQCSVKRHLANPPEFDVRVSPTDTMAADAGSPAGVCG